LEIFHPFHTRGMNDALASAMGRFLNILIISLLVIWVLGMVFSAIFGLLVHVLLVLAIAAVLMRIHVWFRDKRRRGTTSRSTGPRATSGSAT
jgi:Flp pilus assembly protein TadB